MIFDTHAHYDDEAFNEDREKLLNSVFSADAYRIVNIGASMDGSRESIAFAGKYPYIYAAVGLHPDYAADWNDNAKAELSALSKNKKCVAIGEIGLDYYYEDPGRDLQKSAFEGQLALARELKLPVVIHSRDAAKDTLDLIKASGIAEEVRSKACSVGQPFIARLEFETGYFVVDNAVSADSCYRYGHHG